MEAGALDRRALPSDLQFGLRTMAWASVMPMARRLQRGEGLLLAVNLSLAVLAWEEPAAWAASAIVSAATLTLLYFLNDLWDCRRDQLDESKAGPFVDFLVEHRRRLAAVLIVQTLVVIALAFALVGVRAGVAVLVVSTVNLAYSAIFKGIAILDVAIVAVWGAAYAAVSGAQVPLTLLGLVGVMTGICHVFQIWRDRRVDALNHVVTSAVASPWLPRAELLACCVALGALLHVHLGAWVAATAAAPLVLHFAIRSNQAAWLLSKLHYAIVWLLVLREIHVG